MKPMIRGTPLLLGTTLLLLSACGSKPPDVSFRPQTETISGTSVEKPDFTNEAMPKTIDSLEVATASGAADLVNAISGTILIGKEDAPVLTVFTDYACEYCREFSAERQDDVERQYVDPGTIALRIVFVPRSPEGTFMAKTAVCAAKQGAFRSTDKELVIHPVAGDKDLPSLAKRAGLNLKALRTCVAQKSLDAEITAEAKAASGTRVPAFTLGQSSWIGLLEDDELSAIIRKALVR